MTTQEIVGRIKETMAAKYDMTCTATSETKVTLRDKKGRECAHVALVDGAPKITEVRVGRQNLFGSVAYQTLKGLL